MRRWRCGLGEGVGGVDNGDGGGGEGGGGAALAKEHMVKAITVA
jgi:hypothetical protein